MWQRKACSPAGLLPCHLIAHLLRVRMNRLISEEKSKLRDVSYCMSTSSLEKKSESAVCVSPGRVMCQCTMWTLSRRSQQSLVSDQSALPSAPGLHSGTVCSPQLMNLISLSFIFWILMQWSVLFRDIKTHCRRSLTTHETAVTTSGICFVLWKMFILKVQYTTTMIFKFEDRCSKWSCI